MIKNKTMTDYMFFISILLVISFVGNILLVLSNMKYKYKVSKLSYENIENIRVRNEKNLSILNEAIEVESLSNENLLLLYKNYNNISDSMINLWNEYSFYRENQYIFNKKKINNHNTGIYNEVNGIITEYLASLLNKEMENHFQALQLKGEVLEKIVNMRELSGRLNEFYNDFYENKIDNLVGKEKEKKIINKGYWIDMLENINAISEEYLEFDFSII